MDDSTLLKQIIAVIKDGRANCITDSEIILGIKEIIPEKIVEVMKPFKTSPKQLEYLKNYRIEKKKLEQFKDRELKHRLRCQKALERTRFSCLKCGSFEINDIRTNRIEFRQKRNDLRKKIIIVNECPICKGQIKSFGGYL